MSDAKLAWGMVLAAAVAAGVVRWGQPTVREPAPAPTGEVKAPLTPSSFSLAETNSCSAGGCHGHTEPVASNSPGPTPLLNEYTTWLSHDKHANAYRVLRDDPLSLQITGNLGWKKPHEEIRCLACHTNPLAAAEKAPDSPAARLVRPERTCGVGCESCHGPAEKWLEPHVRSGWAASLKASPEQMEEIGWRAMDNLVVRAQTCAGCHVGAPADPKGGLPERNVDHDMIAAGHPRLNFELGSFLANMPPHWNLRRRQASQEAAPTWAIGQVCSAETALRLLAARAEQAPARPWPEFAEYGCFACHHDLKEPSWRQESGYAGRKPGALPFGDWYLTLPRALLAQQGSADAKVLLDELTKLMELMELPSPNLKDVQGKAAAAADHLHQWRLKASLTVFSTRSLRQMVTTVVKEKTNWNWDSAEQLFLAAVALRAAEGDPDFAARHPELTGKRAFLKGFSSPRDFQPSPFAVRLGKILEAPPKE